MVQHLSTAKGVLSLLRESDSTLVQFALRRLKELMDTYWFEIGVDLQIIEELYESTDLTDDTRKLAALVASQAYFHLGAHTESVHFALAAGKAFDEAERSLFTDTILSRCIDLYVEFQSLPADRRGEVDPRLEELFVSLTKKWVLQNESISQVKELVGFTIRARRLDFLETVLRQWLAQTKSPEILNFTLHVANVLLKDIVFRRDILRLLASLYTDGLHTIDYFSLTQCLLFLSDAEMTASIMMDLMRENNKMLAYQLAFELFDYGNQEFLQSVISNIERLAPVPPPGTDEEKPPAPEASSSISNLRSVLTGELTTELHTKFLYSRCKADVHILNHIKKVIDPRLVTHNATVLANALMYSGTTIDGFLRDNIQWLGRATYWGKFTATASVGAIHRGHISQGMTVLEPYLPKSSLGPLPFQEAGALYALGLIHAPVGVVRNKETVEYLKGEIRKYGDNEQMVHGGSLGLGLAAMGLHDEDTYELLLTCMIGADAVGGEGAALGIGLVMMGSGNDMAIQTLKNLAMEESQKEKIIRGISMAIALMNLGRENQALGLANELLDNSDPWVRLGGCFVLGLAFAGTSNISVIEQLLLVVVKDTSDDVKRNAAVMLGFVTLKDPLLCLDLTRALLDSYSPHIRYGVAMALAISAAGSGQKEIIDTLWEMREDLVDFVRQGVYMGLAIVMTQMTEKENPLVKEFRHTIERMAADHTVSACTKIGCVLAAGLLDAGGRNCTFSLHRNRHRLNKSVVGMFIFSQYWYWYPYILMITLSMQPTCFIGLNDKLEMPEYKFKSNAPPSLYEIPKSVLQEKKELKAAGHQAAVVLSTTRKEEELRQKRANNEESEASRGVNPSGLTTAHGEEEKKRSEPEPTFEILHNPARVTARQFSVISHDIDERYIPLKSHAMGVCLLKDTKPNQGEEKLVDLAPIVEMSAAEYEGVLVDSSDATPPKPFPISENNE